MAGGYYELIIDGDERVVRAFLQGFISGRGISKGIIYCSEHKISSHHLRELLHLHNPLHIICRSGIITSVKAVLNNAPEELAIKLSSERAIKNAAFTFKFDTFSKKVASTLKLIFRTPPKGVALTRFDPSEEVSPGAKGVEGYAPLHDYRYWGEGSAQGDVEKVLNFHRKLLDQEFVDAEDIHLVF